MTTLAAVQGYDLAILPTATHAGMLQFVEHDATCIMQQSTQQQVTACCGQRFLCTTAGSVTRTQATGVR